MGNSSEPRPKPTQGFFAQIGYWLHWGWLWLDWGFLVASKVARKLSQKIGGKSLLAALVVFVSGLLSMGALGMGLFWLAFPVMPFDFGDPSQWHGDWVWPASIAVGMLWSLAFLVAGWVIHRPAWLAHQKWLKVLAYGLILWGVALLLWLMVFVSSIRI